MWLFFITFGFVTLLAEDDGLEILDDEDDTKAEPERTGVNMISLGPGHFMRGLDNLPGGDKSGESPAKKARVRHFEIDEIPVTNAQYAAFAQESGYKSDAEKWDWSFVFFAHIHDSLDGKEFQSVKDAPWWVAVEGAHWASPEGGESNVDDRQDYPAVHMSQNDGRAFCSHYGLRLPTENEWEYAARGGLEGKTYPWGDSDKDVVKKMNFYQGKFPEEDLEEDGYGNIAPARAFPPNGYGLYDMIGNKWEWTRSKFRVRGQRTAEEDQVSLRGGSFVDTIDGSANHVLRVTTRMGNTADSSSTNTGFRCARTIKESKDEL